MHWFRPFNLFLLFIFQFILIYNLREPHIDFDVLKYSLIVLPIVLTAAAGYFINNIFDKEIDAINKPHQKSMPEILAKNHKLIYFSINILAIIISVFLYNFVFVGIVIITQILLYLYSASFKKKYIIGNFIVSFLAAISIVSIVFYGNEILKYHVFFFAIFSFLITFIREIIKDMEDEEGDKIFGSTTLAIQKGIPYAKNIAKMITIVLIVVMCYYLISLFMHLQLIPAIWFIIFGIIPVVILLIFIQKAATKKQYAQVSMFCKYNMVSAITTTFFIVGNASGL